MHYIRPWITWGLVLLWMGVIFYLSHQPATVSSELSGGMTTIVVKVIQTITPITFQEDVLHSFIRKSAHFIAYLLLGILLVQAINRGSYLSRGLLALLISILYAMSDEYHQTFIAGRSGEIRDVIIDGLGSLTGILLYLMILYIWKRKTRTFT